MTEEQLTQINGLAGQANKWRKFCRGRPLEALVEITVYELATLGMALDSIKALSDELVETRRRLNDLADELRAVRAIDYLTRRFITKD